MKILLIGDASNYHHTLGLGLSRLGHDVTVASNGSLWMDTRRDINLYRRPGKVWGALLWLRLNTTLARRLKGYDIVQLVNPVFVDQRPHRVEKLFERLKRDNGAIYLTALGTDTAYVRLGLKPNSPLRYTEWAVDGRPTPFATSVTGAEHRLWLTDPLLRLANIVYNNVDGVVAALYEYYLAMKPYTQASNLAYAGIPVDVDSIPFDSRVKDVSEPLKVLAPYHAGRELEKGTDILYDIASRVPGIELQRVTGLRFDEFRNRLMDSHVVLDQYYSYSPATTALMAMAMGKTVVTGAEPDFEAFIGERVPAVNVSPFDHEALRKFLSEADNPHRLQERGEAARDFVRRHHDATVVAQRFVDFWTR